MTSVHKTMSRLVVIFAFAFFCASCDSGQARAEFVLDDFDDTVFTDEEPLEAYRYIEDLFNPPGFPPTPLLFPELQLEQVPGGEALLQYSVSGGYDYASIDTLVFTSITVDSGTEVTAKLNSVDTSIGDFGSYPDEFGIDSDALIFKFGSPLGVVENISFHFTNNDSVGPTWFFASRSLVGVNSVQAVPEPASIFLVSAAFACVAGHRKLKKHNRPNV